MEKGMQKFLKRAALVVMAMSLCAVASAQYVTLQGTLQGSNGTPLPNAILNFTPTQNFYVPGTNTTQPVDNIYGSSAPTGACVISGQMFTVTGTTQIYQCIFGVWVQITGAGGGVTWPASGDLIISNGTSVPAGLAPVNGDCVLGAGGVWTAGTCPGIASIQSQTGPGITLQSAGATVTITTPSSNVINLEASGGGGSGVQFNPSTTIYASGGSSTNEDDNRVTSSAIPLGAWSCNGTTCTFNTTGTNPLTTSDWVDVSATTGWFAIPSGFNLQDTGVGTFKVTAATSSSFTFAYTANTGSGTGGNAYSASYWVPYWTSRMPFINGHGNVWWRFGTCQEDSNSATFNTRYGSLSGTPKIFIFQGCQNDLVAGASAATVEGYLQAIWHNAHAAGFTVYQSTMLPTHLGIGTPSNYYINSMTVSNWMYSQICNYFSTSGQCIDHLIDLGNMQANMATLGTIVGNSPTGGYYVAERINRAIGMQNSGDVTGPPPFFYPNGDGSLGGLPAGMNFWMGPDNPNQWYFLARNQSVIMYLNGENHYATLYSQDGKTNPPRIEADGTVAQYDFFNLTTPSLVSSNTNYRAASSCWYHIAGETWQFCSIFQGSSSTDFYALGAIGVPPNSTSGWPTTGLQLWADGGVTIPSVGTSPSTSPVCPNGTAGRLTTTGCSGGGGGGLNGTVTYTTSTTASTSDANKLVIMNCSSACAYTLPATQPSTTWAAGVTTQGTTVATIALGGGDTWNGGASVPVLNSYRILWVFANTGTATDYRGDAPLSAGSNISLNPSANALQIASSAGATAPTITVANAGTTGTTVNTLAKLTGAPSTAVITATTDTGGAVGVVTGGAGTTGSATIQIAGIVSCVFSGGTTAGDYVGISAATAGNCLDAGASYPSSGQVLGRVLSTNAVAGTYSIDLFPSEIKGVSGGGGGGNYVNIGGSVTWTPTGGTGSFGSGAFSTTSTGVTSINISGIPGTYLDLQLKCSKTSSTVVTGQIRAQFNGDTSAHYAIQGYYSTAGTASPVLYQKTNDSSAVIALSGSGADGSFVLDLPGYNLAQNQNGTSVSTGMGSLGTNSNNVQVTVGFYWVPTSAAAVTSMKLIWDSTETFANGFTCRLYGTN